MELSEEVLQRLVDEGKVEQTGRDWYTVHLEDEDVQISRYSLSAVLHGTIQSVESIDSAERATTEPE